MKLLFTIETARPRNEEIQTDGINRIDRIDIYPVHPVNPVKINERESVYHDLIPEQICSSHLQALLLMKIYFLCGGIPPYIIFYKSHKCDKILKILANY